VPALAPCQSNQQQAQGYQEGKTVEPGVGAEGVLEEARQVTEPLKACSDSLGDVE
jgi:hypothetical protein